MQSTNEPRAQLGGWRAPAQAPLHNLCTLQPSNQQHVLMHWASAHNPTPPQKGDWADKSALCLPVKSGGNCPSTDGSPSILLGREEVRYMCFSAQRPVCWTDAIYHKVVSVLIGGSKGVSVKSDTYGPVIMPTKSDHYPVAGTWTTSIVKEATSVVKAG